MRKSIRYVCVVMLSMVLLSSCGASKQELAPRLSGKWNITEVNGEKTPGDKLPYIEFDTAANRLFGNAGCNSFNAGYKLDPQKPSKIQIMPVASTLMACPDMEMESKVMGAIQNVTEYNNAKDEQGLQLIDKDGKVVLLLEKAKEATAELAGEWDLVELNGAPVSAGDFRQFIHFDLSGKRFSGNAGCNRMTGALEYDESQAGKLKFGDAATTRMACPALESEQKFLTALDEVVRYEATGVDAQQITLYNAEGVKVMVLRKK